MHESIASHPPAPVTAPDPARVDFYGPVHKGLRWALSSLLARMGALDPSDRERWLAMVEELRSVLSLCASHLRHEDEHIHAALERRQPGSAARLAREHDERERALATLRALSASLAAAPASSRPVLAHSLYLSFATFVADDLAHMNHEETVTAPLLESLFSAEELAAMHDALLASIAPEEMQAFLRIMIPGNDRAFRVAMLGSVRDALPAADFAELVRSFHGPLGADDYADLTTKLGVPG